MRPSMREVDQANSSWSSDDICGENVRMFDATHVDKERSAEQA
jgi:hypothetical protein